MASSSIVILRQAGAISSAYRPLIFKIQSSVVAPELQIKAELYARNTLVNPAILIATKYEKRYMGLAYFIFDFSNILQTMLTFDRNIALTPAYTTPTTNSIVEYYVKFTEVYYNAYGNPTAYNSITSDTLKAINAIPQNADDQTLTNYILTSNIAQQGAFQNSGDFSMDFK